VGDVKHPLQTLWVSMHYVLRRHFYSQDDHLYLYAQPFWVSIATSHIGYNHGESK
jgi:hypothetical protein